MALACTYKPITINKKEKEEMKNGREKVGCVCVDAGCVTVGDPCYLLPGVPMTAEQLQVMYEQICGARDNNGLEYTNEEEKDEHMLVHNFDFPLNNSREFGIQQGVTIKSGYGDGCYPVYVTWRNGIPAKIEVDFFCDDDDEEEDYE